MEKHRFTIILVILFVVFIGIEMIEAQEQERGNPKAKEARLTTDGVSYMEPSNPEKHSNFTVNYKVNSNLFFELQGHYDTYPLADVFRVPIMAKRYLTGKIYVFSGGEVEFTRRYIQDLEPILPQFRLINGFGYDVNSHFSIEAQKNIDFNTSTISPYSTPNALSIKGKFKF